MKEVVSIVVTYNAAPWIQRCISSLMQSSIETDIVVIDNGSTDDTIAIIEQEFPLVQLKKLSQNLGFGKANNLGLIESFPKNYGHYFLLNQDAWLTSEDTLSDLVAYQKKEQQVGILSPVHLEKSMTQLDKHFEHYMKGHPKLEIMAQGEATVKFYEVDFINAAAWLISRECLQCVGLIHPLFDHYGEDVNYVDRVKSAGFKIGALDQTYIVHDRNYRSRKSAVKDGKKTFQRRMLIFLLDPAKSPSNIRLWMKAAELFTKMMSIYGFFASLAYLKWCYCKTLQLKNDVDSFDSRKLQINK